MKTKIIALCVIVIGLSVFTGCTQQENPATCPAGDTEIECTDSEAYTCTDEEKQAEICTLDWNPVCGSDGVTYGNGCGACSAKVDSWVSGECAE